MFKLESVKSSYAIQDNVTHALVLFLRFAMCKLLDADIFVKGIHTIVNALFQRGIIPSVSFHGEHIIHCMISLFYSE